METPSTFAAALSALYARAHVAAHTCFGRIRWRILDEEKRVFDWLLEHSSLWVEPATHEALLKRLNIRDGTDMIASTREKSRHMKPRERPS